MIEGSPLLNGPPAPPVPRWWQRAAAIVGPQHLALVLFGTLLLVLRLTFQRPLSFHSIMSVRYAFWMMLCFAAVAALRAMRTPAASAGARYRQALQMVWDWFPFVVCLWVYENLHDLTLWIRPDTVDAALASLDLAIFGVQPTHWLAHRTHPLLTDYMALAYMTYFVFPPLLAGWLYLRGEVPAFRELQLALLSGFYLGFLGYITVPAVGPQLVLSYEAPLHGEYFFWGAKQAVASLQSFPRDCFPSMHTTVSSITLWFFVRHRRAIPAWGVIAVPVTLLTVSLWVSTVYLRYHWVVDVLAGFALAALASVLGVLVRRRWPCPAPRAPQSLAAAPR